MNTEEYAKTLDDWYKTENYKAFCKWYKERGITYNHGKWTHDFMCGDIWRELLEFLASSLPTDHERYDKMSIEYTELFLELAAEKEKVKRLQDELKLIDEDAVRISREHCDYRCAMSHVIRDECQNPDDSSDHFGCHPDTVSEIQDLLDNTERISGWASPEEVGRLKAAGDAIVTALHTYHAKGKTLLDAESALVTATEQWEIANGRDPFKSMTPEEYESFKQSQRAKESK